MINKFKKTICHAELVSASNHTSLDGKIPNSESSNMSNKSPLRDDKTCFNLAFTLAETLMTLAIIGIVAAITIPTLVGNYNKQQYVTQLKKVYTEMSQAVKQLKNDREVDSVSETGLLTRDEAESGEDSWQREGQFLKQYFKVVKDCGIESPSSCFASNYKTISGTPVGYVQTMGYSVITASGPSIMIGYGGSKWDIPTLGVDINGPKGPNIVGRDFFMFSIYYDGSIDEVTPQCCNGGGNFPCDGRTKEQAREDRFSLCLISGYGSGCFAKILNDGWKMDY